MTFKKSEKAFQFLVFTPAFAGKQIFLVDGISEPMAERRLRDHLAGSASISFQRAANSEDIARANLMSGGVVKLL